MPTYYDNNDNLENIYSYHRYSNNYIILYMIYAIIYIITFTVFLPISYYIYDQYWISNHIN